MTLLQSLRPSGACGYPLWIPPAKSDQIESLVRKYGDLVRSRIDEEELSENLQALYETIFAPIARALPSQTRRIIISPDGQISLVSFVTLLADDNQFLAQKYGIRYFTTGRDLLGSTNPSTAKSVILFADPNFNSGARTILPMVEESSSSDASPSSLVLEKSALENWDPGAPEIVALPVFEGLTHRPRSKVGRLGLEFGHSKNYLGESKARRLTYCCGQTGTVC